MLAPALVTALVTACGARTDLTLTPSAGVAVDSGGVASRDAAGGGDGGAAVDARAGVDAGVDAPAVDSGEDASSPVCTTTEVAYLLDGSGALYRYDAPTGKTTLLGTPACGDDNIPWTMTVGRTSAYVVFTEDWLIYAVDLETLECTLTPFEPGQLGLNAEFGVAVSGTGGIERLFYFGLPEYGSAPLLAVSDLETFVLSEVGPIAPSPPSAGDIPNLTADSLGSLYAYSPSGLLQQIDEATGVVVHDFETHVTTSGSWANVLWGGDDYVIADALAVRYDLATSRAVSRRDIGIGPCGGGSFRVTSCRP